MKKEKRRHCNLLSPFGVQMGHDWGMCTLAYFHTSGKLPKAFSTTTTELNAPYHFLCEMGYVRVHSPEKHDFSHTANPR